MEFFTNLNLAYIFIVTAVMMAIASILFPKSAMYKVGMVICLGVSAYELSHFLADPWALVVTALSPLPFFLATKLPALRRLLLPFTAGMLVFGSVFLFLDKNGHPEVNPALLWLVSILCAEFIWVFTEHRLNSQGTGREARFNPFIGIIGKAITDVYEIGLVQIDGETWSARSDRLIPSGSSVRILKDEGMVLVVKKIENLTSE